MIDDTTKLVDRAHRLAEEHDGDAQLGNAIVKFAREHAAKTLRSIYEVSNDDQQSSDGARARGSYNVKREYAGDPCVEKRHYRQIFESMIAEVIAAAENAE